MKITDIRSRIVHLPLVKRAVSRSGAFEAMWYLLVDVATDEGIVGSTYLWAYSAAGAGALRHVLAELAAVAVGEDPFFSAQGWRRIWDRTTQWGHAGLAVVGMSVIDTAAWDIVGKA